MEAKSETFFGKVVSDLFYSRTAKGIPVCQFTLLTSSPSTFRIRAVIFGKDADGCSVYLRQGKEVFLQGIKRLRTVVQPEGVSRKVEELCVQKVGHLGLI